MNTHSSLTSFAAPRPTCDAWCVFEIDGASNPVILSSSGVNSVTRIQTGVYRVFFTNPERFPGGGYLAFVQNELGNAAGSYGVPLPHGLTASSVSVQAASPNSCDITAWNVDTANPNFGDTGNAAKARINAVFFSLRSDSDNGKPFIQNYLGYSQQFSNWTSEPPNTTFIFSNTEETTAPDGTVTASKYIAGGNYYVQFLPAVIGVTATFSIHAKAGSGETFGVYIGGVNNNFGSIFNLRNNTVLTPSGSNTTSPVRYSYTSSITQLPEGWRRCSITFNTAHTPAPLITLSDSSMADKFVYVWGAQVELGTVPTRYIKTEGVYPLLGDQDQLVSYSPSSAGFGRESRQNLLRHSENFTDSYWLKTRIGVSAGQYVAPDGTTTAMKLHEVDPISPGYEAAINGTLHYKQMWFYLVGTTTGVGPYVFSVHAKAAERNYLSFTDTSYGSFGALTVDLTTGVVTENSNKQWVDVRNCGNGWWRVATILRNSGSPANAAMAPGIAPYMNPTGGSIYGPTELGVSGSGILIWGAQLENGHIWGDYTKTSGTPYGTTFARVGVTYSSEYGAITSRQATAWGTIVIPPITSTISPPSFYLENHYGVDRVIDDRTGGGSNSAFRVFFSEPMNTDAYCVMLSNETETVNPSDNPLSSATPVPAPDEFNLLVIQNDSGSPQGQQRKRESFSVRILKQVPSGSDVSFGQRSSFYQSGKTQRIHFIVFGGKAYYGSE